MLLLLPKPLLPTKLLHLKLLIAIIRPKILRKKGGNSIVQLNLSDRIENTT